MGLPAPAEADGSSGNEARGQLLVADGKNLWFYDRELAQITVKPVEAALSATPIDAAVGLGRAAARQLRHQRRRRARRARWVEVKPRSAEADSVVPNSGSAATNLARMIVNDRLGSDRATGFLS